MGIVLDIIALTKVFTQISNIPFTTTEPLEFLGEARLSRNLGLSLFMASLVTL